MQRGLRVITLHGAIEKSSKLEWLDGTIVISYFDGRNIVLFSIAPHLVIALITLR